MKTQMNGWQKTLSVAAVATLAATAFPTTSIASPEETSFQNRNEFQMAQVTSCREVDADSGLNVRNEPWGQVIGRLDNNQNVYLENPEMASGNWVQIEAPYDGYVAAKFLDYCTASVPDPAPVPEPDLMVDECREVEAFGGLNVRATPSVASNVITTIPNDSFVNIESPGTDGWVPIDEPVDGYVAAEYLTYCSADNIY